MVKAKVASKVAKPILQNKRVQQFLGGAGASVIDELLDNPIISATEGALIGAAVGGPVGAVGGGLAGFYLADKGTVFPVDMVCIPAYQSFMIQGNPAFTVYARAGETVVPTGGNVADVTMVTEPTGATSRPKRKMSKWNRYVKNKKNHIKMKNGKLDLKKMAKKFRGGK
tara:strand:- start:1764 stop:2270 length:507 start_codon:yes stop_codon:yes gene_type:complete